LHSEERPEYAAHGEYLNVSSAANRYSAESDHVELPTDAASPGKRKRNGAHAFGH